MFEDRKLSLDREKVEGMLTMGQKKAITKELRDR